MPVPEFMPAREQLVTLLLLVAEWLRKPGFVCSFMGGGDICNSVRSNQQRSFAQANVAYLNLAAPLSEEIVCKLPRDCSNLRGSFLLFVHRHAMQEECASNPDPASCTVDLEDRRFWRGKGVI